MSGYTTNELFKVVHPESGEINNNPNRKISYEKCIEILKLYKLLAAASLLFILTTQRFIRPY
jgi:hypothetical protein